MVRILKITARLKKYFFFYLIIFNKRNILWQKSTNISFTNINLLKMIEKCMHESPVINLPVQYFSKTWKSYSPLSKFLDTTLEASISEC